MSGSKIIFNAEDDVLDVIEKWQDYLKNQKRYSEHTVSAYSRDLAFFINYFSDNDNIVNLDFLSNLDIRDFRAFISFRASKHIEKYNKKYATFKKLYPTLKEVFKEM